MKGVVLAGGLGTRLRPLTKITNKHLLPVYDKPMIYYPLSTLVEAGIEDIIIVTGGNNAGDFLRLLGNGREFGLKHLNYTYQEREGGIAEAIGLVEDFVDGDRFVVILGDNIIEDNVAGAASRFRDQPSGAKVFLKAVDNPTQYGVAELKDGRIVDIVEKPERPTSNYAVVGIYMYDEQVFEIIRSLEPSARGELEVTDVSTAYLRRGELSHEILQGWWADPGASIDSLLDANNVVASMVRSGNWKKAGA